MSLETHHVFIAVDYPLVFFKGKPILNKVIRFYEKDGETPFDLSGASGATLTIYDERLNGGYVVLSFSTADQLAISENAVIINASAEATNVPDLGKYYYELEYLDAGGYSVPLCYGEAKFI